VSWNSRFWFPQEIADNQCLRVPPHIAGQGLPLYGDDDDGDFLAEGSTFNDQKPDYHLEISLRQNDFHFSNNYLNVQRFS
jgi:hypothetical protein